MPDYQVLVNGVERECSWDEFEIREAMNRVQVLRGKFISHDASYRPEVDDEIIISEDSDRIFGGVIDLAEESAAAGPAIPDIVTRINGVGFASYADRRYINATIPAGTLKSQLLVLETYLTDYGVSLDGAQVDGPTMEPLVLEWRKLTDALNDLSSLTSGTGGSPTSPPYVWEIDYFKVLRMFQLGGTAAPVNVIEGDAVEVGDLIVTPTRRDYANRIILLSGATPTVTQADNLVEQGLHELWEMKVTTTAELTPDVAQQAADGLLTQYAFRQREARYDTVSLGLHPGQIQTITSAKRNVDASFLITEVVTRQERGNNGMLRSVTAIEGYRLQGSWQDYLQRLVNGSTVPTVGSGGFGGGGGGLSCCDAIGAGALAFSGYGDSPMKFLKASGAALPDPENQPWIGTATGSSGCQGIVALDDGTICITGAGYPSPNFEHVLAMDPTFTTILGYSQLGPIASIASNYVDAFYAVKMPAVANYQAFKYDNTGTKVADFDLGVNLFPDYVALGAAPDESAFYFGARGSDTVRKRDVGGASTATFVTETGYQLHDNCILVLRNGDVLVGWDKSGSGNGFVKHYDSSGALLFTYPLIGLNTTPLCLTPGLTPFTFWVNYYDGSLSTYSTIRVAEIQIEAGCIANQFAPEDGTFEFDGPFCVLRANVNG